MEGDLAFNRRGELGPAQASLLSAFGDRSVRAAEGPVVWSKTHWEGFERGANGFVSLGAVPLPPGPFRFYLHKTWVVGAESLLGPGAYSFGDMHFDLSFFSPSQETRASPVPIGDRRMFEGVLAEVFGFGTAELEANRRGERTGKQGGGPIAALEGVAQHHWDLRNKWSPKASILFAGERFGASEIQRAALVPGLAYRFFVDPMTRRIWSLELL